MNCKIIHEVEHHGNLYFLLNGFNGALNKLAESIGGGLTAIAVALAGGQSPETQAKIDALTADLKKSTDELQAAEDAAK